MNGNSHARMLLKIAAGFFLPRQFLANSTPIFTRFKKMKTILNCHIY
jgi:hypothetical protein